MMAFMALEQGVNLLYGFSGYLPFGYFPDGGEIRYHGNDIVHWPLHKRARKGINRIFHLPKPFKSFAVLDNISLF